MNWLAATPFDFPDEAVLDFYDLDRLRNPVLAAAAQYWNDLRGTRPFPTRDELNPAGFAPALRHMALVKLIDGGNDFEYRIMGDTLAGAFSTPVRGRPLSVIEAQAPITMNVIRAVYNKSITSGMPLALSGTTGRNAQTAMFTHFEALVLPLGGETIDHLLTFMVCQAPTPAA